jgi:hypothetical protein
MTLTSPAGSVSVTSCQMRWFPKVFERFSTTTSTPKAHLRWCQGQAYLLASTLTSPVSASKIHSVFLTLMTMRLREIVTSCAKFWSMRRSAYTDERNGVHMIHLTGGKEIKEVGPLGRSAASALPSRGLSATRRVNFHVICVWCGLTTVPGRGSRLRRAGAARRPAQRARLRGAARTRHAAVGLGQRRPSAIFAMPSLIIRPYSSSPKASIVDCACCRCSRARSRSPSLR